MFGFIHIDTFVYMYAFLEFSILDSSSEGLFLIAHTSRMNYGN